MEQSGQHRSHLMQKSLMKQYERMMRVTWNIDLDRGSYNWICGRVYDAVRVRVSEQAHISVLSSGLTPSDARNKSANVDVQ